MNFLDFFIPSLAGTALGVCFVWILFSGITILMIIYSVLFCLGVCSIMGLLVCAFSKPED